MIAAALEVLRAQLDEALRRRSDWQEDLVVLTGPVASDGTTAPQAADRLAMFLVNVERELASHVPGRVDSGTGRLGMRGAPLQINLLLMVAAGFSGSGYPEALRRIGATLAFFQSKPVFDHQNTPALDPRIERLSLELEPLPLADLCNLWGVLGGHYLPSAMYRLRMLTIGADELQAQVPPVTRPAVSAGA